MPTWLVDIPAGFWDVLSDMSPYLLLGFLAAGALSVFISPAFVERHLGGRGVLPVLKAAAFGVPLPLCSCGVIPVSASMRRHGASKGATVGFLISTPQTGVDSIFVTFSLLGAAFAVFRPLVALASGLIGGAAVSALDKDGGGAGQPAAAEPCQDACCADPERSKLYRMFSYGFGELPRDIGKALLLGLLIAAVISAAVPTDYLAGVLGGGIGAMLIMMALGIPVYVCATASVPVAAAMVLKGVSPGAALVFLMTGPATNAATIATVWRVLGRRTAVVYLLTVAGSALASGLLLDYVFRLGQIKAGRPAMGWMLPEYVRWACTVVLLGLLGRAALWPRIHRWVAKDPHKHENTTELRIRGMTCGHCVQSVRRALLECAGVASVEVDLASGAAAVAGSNLDASALHRAVEGLGYDVSDAGES